MGMKYEIKILECRREVAEAEFNLFAADGWSLSSCWPSPSGTNLVGVFQRQRIVQAHEGEPRDLVGSSHRPPRPSAPQKENEGLTLDEVLAACLEHPPAQEGFSFGVSVNSIAKQHHLSQDEALDLLRALGLKSKEDEPEKYSIPYEGHAIWLKHSAKGGWFVNARPMKHR